MGGYDTLQIQAPRLQFPGPCNALIKGSTARAAAYPEILKTFIVESRAALRAYLLFALEEFTDPGEASRVVRKSIGKISTWDSTLNSRIPIIRTPK